MNKRKEYMRNTYAAYWKSARNNNYGFMVYDKAVIDLIFKQTMSGSKLLEVAIGTGVPIAKELFDRKYQVYGIDISDILIDECRANCPKINCCVADAELLPFKSSKFHLTYCIHSAWFITDFHKSVTDMIRVTSKGGRVIFDIQNKYNKTIIGIYRQHIFENSNLIGRLYKTIKNVSKFILQRGTQDWPFVVSQTPSDPVAIFKLLSHQKLSSIDLYGWDGSSLIELYGKSETHEEFSRLIFAITK